MLAANLPDEIRSAAPLDRPPLPLPMVFLAGVARLAGELARSGERAGALPPHQPQDDQ